LAAVLTILFALALAQPAAAGATIAVDAQRHGDAIDIRATAVLTTDADTAWRVLTDYGRYPEFIPDLHSSRVVARHGSEATVEQTGDVTLWPFHFPVDITFEIHERPPDSVESRAVAGSLRALTSRYVLARLEAGTRLDYSGHVDLGSAWLRDIQQVAIERTVARQFRALADEIERQGVAARLNSTAGEK
jgi:ribosome-associated toxin RatA of RatAB toxin-antitoxin module